MPSLTLAESRSITLDGAGAGAVHWGPVQGVMWRLTVASVQVSSANAEPICNVSVGSASGAGTLVDATYTGSQDSTDRVAGVAVYPGAEIWATWTGGDPGATATLTLYGESVTGYRAAGGA